MWYGNELFIVTCCSYNILSSINNAMSFKVIDENTSREGVNVLLILVYSEKVDWWMVMCVLHKGSCYVGGHEFRYNYYCWHSLYVALSVYS